MSIEIGSNFEFDNSLLLNNERKIDWLPKLGDYTFTFSGRSAIDLAIRDIRCYKRVINVYMPSYCCDSMIAPFINNNISIKFYSVRFSSTDSLIYEIDTEVKCDIFFAMSYFGLEENNLKKIVDKFAEKGSIIIEDVTHSLLTDPSYLKRSNYCVASLRKWFAIPTGGYVSKRDGRLFEKPYLESDNLVEQQIEAMKEKSRYLKGNYIDKEIFLSKFKEFEEKLNNIDYRFKIDGISYNIIKNINIEKIIFRRRNNARVLYEGINGIDYLQFMFPNPDLSQKCPLFVPVLVENNNRDGLRQHLIKNNMFFPVHWPIPEINYKFSTDVLYIYNSELSLVCDQRYTTDDMRRIIKAIKEFFKEKVIL